MLFSNYNHDLIVNFYCFSWSKTVIVDPAVALANLSNVTMTHGRGFVKDKVRCGLCGLKNGLKTKCCEPSCRGFGERKNPYHFHVTCARQAGYEVDHKEDDPRVTEDEDFFGELLEIILKMVFILMAKSLHS